MANFVMVPAESLKQGDVVAPARTPLRDARPVAEVHLRADGVVLVFVEKSLHSDEAIRVTEMYPYQHACALVGGVDEAINATVENWIAEATQ